MDYQQGQSLNKLALYTTCMDDMVPVDNTVHLIDQFVDSLDMRSLGFKMMSTQGKPPYHPADLLKLYIYGYMNRIRSSRQLEKECHCNLEVIWLFKNLKPDHNTIARFRKDNPKVNGKIVQRTQYATHIESNAQRVGENKGLYKQRQALVEHPFGTMKRQWGFDHIMTKREILAASADMGLIALAYNLRRLFNIRASKSKALSGMSMGLLMSILALLRHFWKIWGGYNRISCILGKKNLNRQNLS